MSLALLHQNQIQPSRSPTDDVLTLDPINMTFYTLKLQHSEIQNTHLDRTHTNTHTHTHIYMSNENNDDSNKSKLKAGLNSWMSGPSALGPTHNGRFD